MIPKVGKKYLKIYDPEWYEVDRVEKVLIQVTGINKIKKTYDFKVLKSDSNEIFDDTNRKQTYFDEIDNRNKNLKPYNKLVDILYFNK